MQPEQVQHFVDICNYPLAITHPPVDIPHSSISMLWHKRQSADKGLIWLRKHIKQIFVKRRAEQVEKVLNIIDS